MANAGDPLVAMFEPQSMRAIAQLDNYQVLLAGALMLANPVATQIIIDAIPGVTDWQNSQGVLDYSFYIIQKTPYTLIFGSDLPYAHRQDEGFVGTDSMGREYNQEGAHYVDKAIAASIDQVETVYEDAVQAFLTNQFGRYS